MNGKLKKCPACGKFFTCHGERDCWCEEVQIHRKEFLILTQKYTDCICQDCLKQYAD
jgi:hypothetical protein